MGMSRRAVPRRTPGRRLVRAVVLASGVFLLLSMVTYTGAEIARGDLFGSIGRAAAWPLLASLGFGAFALFGLMAFWGLSAIFGREPSRPLVNAAGIVLVTLSAAALASAALDSGAYRSGGLYGPGGRAGAQLARFVSMAGGTPTVLVAAGLGIAAGLVLGTDRLALALVRDGATAGRRTAERLADAAPRIADRATRCGRWVRRSVSVLTGGRPRPAQSVRIPMLEEPRFSRASAAGSPAAGVTLDDPPAELDLDETEERAAQPGRDAIDLDDRRIHDESMVVPVKEEESREAPAAGRLELGLSESGPSRASSRPKRSARSDSRKKTRSPDDEFELPPYSLLDSRKARDPKAQEAMIRENADILDETLRDFRVEAEVVAYRQGPVVTLFELDLAAGVKVNRIHNLAEDLAVALKAPAVRIVSPLPGKSTIGVEVPNPIRDDVRLKALLQSELFERNQDAIPIFMGADVAGLPLIEDLASMPHLLIAGATGSGKSVCINSILTSILLTRTPEQVRMILLDPKQVELAFFDRVPHLMCPVVRDMKKALTVLEWLVDQMEQRYALFHTLEVRNIHSYNELGAKAIRERVEELDLDEEEVPELLPYVVMVVDELGELMLVAGKEIENLITRLAQKSRAVGIHIVLATQRPSTDVITGLIKANMPCRASFQVASKIDSRVVLDRNGAETLLGRGDMLYLPPRTSHLVRAQGTFVSDGEVKRVVKFLARHGEQEFDESLEKAQTGEALRDEDKDPRYDDAVRVVLEEGRGSASLLQRALGVGYTRGSRILEQMHKEGIVGPYKGSKAREVLLTLEEWEAQYGTNGQGV